MPFYITRSEYIGPNLSKRCNTHTYSISTIAPRTNSSREIRINGWLGTTNDWAAFAHGEFETEEAARSEIDHLLPEGCRELDCDEPIGYNAATNSVIYDVAQFAVGKYVEVDAESSVSYCYVSIQADVSADSTDEQIDTLLGEYESEANVANEPFTLDTGAVRREMTIHRDKLIAERNAIGEE